LHRTAPVQLELPPVVHRFSIYGVVAQGTSNREDLVVQRRKPPAPAPGFFATPADFRKWLERNHATATELWVGYYKKATGRPSLTWPESVDEALCFGWIDGIRKSIDGEAYMIRFTPRRPTSIWSQVNLGRVEVLTAEGRMRPEGIAAWERRDRTKVYSFEQAERPGLDAAAEKQFRKNRKAWEWFQKQAPGIDGSPGSM
jgi:uncharacterized protein YdeI (YjbR/CyaY-like superfamily)